MASLDEAIVVMGQEMPGVELEGQELEDLVAFMNALTGDIPAFPVPALPYVPAVCRAGDQAGPATAAGPTFAPGGRPARNLHRP